MKICITVFILCVLYELESICAGCRTTEDKKAFWNHYILDVFIPGTIDIFQEILFWIWYGLRFARADIINVWILGNFPYCGPVQYPPEPFDDPQFCNDTWGQQVERKIKNWLKAHWGF